VLSIDHVEGGGNKHRLIVGYGTTFYEWLENEGFPKDGYRLLCLNCNAARTRNRGVCPHEGRVDDPAPFRCVVCGGPLLGTNGQRPVCKSCRAALKAQYGTMALPNCLLCGAPLAKPISGARYFCEECAKLRKKEAARRLVRSYLEKVVAAYGGRCAHCGEEELLFLTIDHIEGGGSEDRKLGRGGVAMYKWLLDNDYPPGYQVLCWNCNWKKGPGAAEGPPDE
jgi:hypothetical protein